MDCGNYGVWALEHDEVSAVWNDDLFSACRKVRLFGLQFVYPNIPDLVFNFLG